MTMTMTIRPSHADLAFKCPASALSAIKIDQDNEAARLGSAVHQLMAAHCDPTGFRPILIDEVAAEWSVSVDDLTLLFDRGCKLWSMLKPLFPNPLVEKTLHHEEPGLEMVGHPDVIAVEPPQIRVLDFKSGRDIEKHAHQLRSYAWLALQDVPDCTEVLLVHAWLRDATIDQDVLTIQELNLWHETFMRQLQNKSESYTPGTHCEHCPRRFNCPGRDEFLGSQMIAIGGKLDVAPTVEITLNSGPEIKVLLDTLSMISNYEQEARNRVRAFIEENGPIPLGEGREFRLAGGSKDQINPQSAWPHVVEALGGDQDALARCITMGVTKLKSEVMARHPRGSKKAAYEILESQLRQAGAMQSVPVTPRLVIGKATLKEAPDDKQEGTGSPG